MENVLELDRLVGQSRTEAQLAVERAGGFARVRGPEAFVDVDVVPGRVTLIVEGGVVTEAWTDHD